MVNLSSEENWQIIYQESREVSGDPGYNNRISNILIPIPFLSEYFKIFANTTKGKTTWNWAGRLYLYIGSISNPVPEYYSSTGIILNEWKIVNFPGIKLTQESHLSFKAPYWMPDINITILQYQETI